MADRLEPTDTNRYEQLYTMLLENIPSSVLLIDQRTRVTVANQNFLNKSRRSRSDTIGRKLEEVFPAVILNQLKILDNVHKVFASGQATSGQRMYYRAPGVAFRYYYYRLLPVAWQGRVDNVILLMDDITDQVELGQEMQRLQSHLAQVVESASEIVISTDSTGKILSWNTAAENLTGHSFQSVKGLSFSNYIDPESCQQIEDIIVQAGGGSSPQMIECELISRQGDKIIVSWVFSSMQPDAGQPVGVVAVGRDLSQQRILEQQLLHSEKLASLGVMAGGIAHEVRNPLAICSSAAQFLMDDDITVDFRKDCAAKIHSNITKASVIIENLLNFSRAVPGDEKNPVLMGDLLQDVLLLVANQAKLHRVKIESTMPDDQCRVCGNASLLQQLFINLLLNGIKSMPEGGLLQVDLCTTDEQIVVTVTDTGCGIPEEHLGKIFDPFFTTAPVGEGTGLGLALCYSIVEQHNGTISVASTEGEGSVFTVCFPISKA